MYDHNFWFVRFKYIISYHDSVFGIKLKYFIVMKNGSCEHQRRFGGKNMEFRKNVRTLGTLVLSQNGAEILITSRLHTVQELLGTDGAVRARGRARRPGDIPPQRALSTVAAALVYQRPVECSGGRFQGLPHRR